MNYQLNRLPDCVTANAPPTTSRPKKSSPIAVATPPQHAFLFFCSKISAGVAASSWTKMT